MILTPEEMQRLLYKSLGSGLSFGEIFVQTMDKLSIVLRNDTITKINPASVSGLAIRTVYDSQVGYGITESFDKKSLDLAVNACKTLFSDNYTGWGYTFPTKINEQDTASKTWIENPINELSQVKKIEFMKKARQAAFDYDQRVIQVMVYYDEQVINNKIFTSEEKYINETKNILEFRVVVVAKEGSNSRMGLEGFGVNEDARTFDKYSAVDIAKTAAQSAISMLQAKPAPAGKMVVVVNNGAGRGGSLFHEGCGHALEADFITKKISVFQGKLGKKVGNPELTILDDATIPGSKGSFLFDDEGTKAQKTCLIRNGILENFMSDRIRAGLKPSTGNGRRDSYRFIPIPRQTNLVIEPGCCTQQDIIRATKKGIFAKTIGGGIVDSSRGDFSFNLREAYLIENGEITTPLMGVMINGNGPEMLLKIDMVGNDYMPDPGIGFCGKENQRVPIGMGCPTVRILEMNVGGTV